MALPLVFEWAASENSARVGALIYDQDSKEIELIAYRPAGAFLRCGYLLCFVTTIFLLGRGGYDLLPDNGWVVVAIIAPLIVYIVWAGAAYWRSIAKAAVQEGWLRRL